MSNQKYQLIGILGFGISGVIFTVQAVRAGDVVITVASVIWLLSCVAWAAPLLSTSEN